MEILMLWTLIWHVTVDTQNCMILWRNSVINTIIEHQDPVVQSIVSLTISLKHKFVKQISAKVTNTLYFFVEKM